MADFSTDGIEDTFIGQPHGRKGRVRDEYELIGRYLRWRTDGIRTPLPERYGQLVANGAPRIDATA